MPNDRYVNAPVEPQVYDALAEQARDNGRPVGRELAQIAKQALRKRLAKPAANA